MILILFYLKEVLCQTGPIQYFCIANDIETASSTIHSKLRALFVAIIDLTPQSQYQDPDHDA
jgi:hypothetical protein